MTPSKIASLAVLAALLIAPAAAIAQSAVGDQYCDPLAPSGCTHKSTGGNGSSGGAGGTSSRASMGSAGANGHDPGPTESAAARARLKTGLPATGVSIAAILAFGVALLASGLALRQLAVEPIR